MRRIYSPQERTTARRAADVMKPMSHSELANYIVPGLSSFLLGGGDAGRVRMFSSERTKQVGAITPHSHRFDFAACVMAGVVHNTVWTESRGSDGDLFAATKLTYGSTPGAYTTERGVDARYAGRTTTYQPGEWYVMRAAEIHSIVFEDRAQVLFMEGPTLTAYSYALEPVVRGTRVPTLRTEPWMFQPVDKE